MTPPQPNEKFEALLEYLRAAAASTSPAISVPA